MIKVDIIIPVYFAPELTVRCIQYVIKNTDLSNLDVKIIVVDDSGSQKNQNVLNFIFEKLGFRNKVNLLIHETNKGFIEACYTGINFREADYKVLLNTDTLVMPGWLTEMVRTAESDQKIAMVNPNTNNSPVIDVPMPEGFNINIMHSYFRNIEEDNNDFIDLVTATGFCLLIKSEYIKKFGFLDRIYGKGYCEETDLYFRFITQGLRAVLARKAFVYHRGEASFTDRDNRYNHNKRILMERYQSVYQGTIGNFNSKTVLNKYRKDLNQKKELTLDVIIFSPSNHIDGGGKKIISNICNSLNEHGISATMACSQMFSNTPLDDKLYAPISVNKLYELDIKPKILAFSLDYNAIDIVKYANTIYKKYNYFPKIVHLMQDVEGWFEANNIEDFEICSKLAISKLIVSPFLEDTFKDNLNKNCHYSTILNSISLDFATPRQERTNKSFTICAMMRNDQKRGSKLIEASLQIISKRLNSPINFISFGEFEMNRSFKNINIIQKGVCDEASIVKILQQSDLFIEASYFQGFGMTSFEALFAGCHVISSYNSGALSVLPESHLVSFFNIGDSVDLAEKILKLIDEMNLKPAMENNELLFDFSSRNIFPKYKKYFEEIFEMPTYTDGEFYQRAFDVLEVNQKFAISPVTSKRIRYKTADRFMKYLDQNPYLYESVKKMYGFSKKAVKLIIPYQE